MHEGVHTSLDGAHLMSETYKAAQANDTHFVSPYGKEFPEREDLAESFEPWFILRYRKEQIGDQLAEKIMSMIPNRVAFFDSLNLDISPNY
jgi:hypothetical protein